MARGKETCRILKEIRRQIAEANDIEFITSECRYKGDCLGTCPKCEAEVRYLEQQLRARSLSGKAVALAGISAGMILLSGCDGTASRQTSDTLQGEPISVIEEDSSSTQGMVNKDTNLVSRVLIKKDSDGQQDKKTTATKDNVVVKKSKKVKSAQTADAAQNTVVPPFFGEIIESIATFPGGHQKLMEWLSQHVVYPPNARDAHIEGRVVVQFEVKTDGTVGDAEIIRSVDDMLDTEALRVVKLLPRFNPAMLNGKAVESVFILPIIFKLTD